MEPFKRWQINFTWSYIDIPGFNPYLTIHHPNISLGASINNRTQHGSGADILFITPQGHTIPKAYKLIFSCTNNTAKYEALVTGIKMAIEWNITQLQVFGDFQLAINQINDDYQTKDEKLMPYKKMVDDIKKYFVEITFQQIPRNDNKAADAMATLASLLQTQENQQRYEFLVEDLFYPTHNCPDSQTICHLVRHDSSRYSQTYTYLKDNTLPPDLSKNQKRNFIRQSSHFTLVADTRFKRGLDGTLLRCLEQE